MMEENNRKGPNAFYAVIGVATLVVAIIGATFAYFSASQTNSDITGTTAEAGGLEIAVTPITDRTNNNIIPLNLITGQGTSDTVDQFDKAMEKKCKDDLGNNICTVYKVVVSNKSKTSTIQVRGKLNLTSTTANMYWTLIDATTTESVVEDQTVVSLNTATAKDDFVKVQQGKDGFITYSAATDETTGLNKGANLSLVGTEGSGNSSATFYVLVWLEEIGEEQQDQDASTAESPKTYTGTITFDAVDANGSKSGVTATFLS